MVTPNPAVTRTEIVERMTHEEFMEVAPDNRKVELAEGCLAVAERWRRTS